MIFDGIEFTQRQMRPGDDSRWVVDAVRVSDQHPLTPQFFSIRALTDDEMAEYAAAWSVEYTAKHGHAPHVGPTPVHCYACGVQLVSDHDTDYQFDNALWIGLHGGYGMFVDSCDFPTNTSDAWLRGADGQYLTTVNLQGHDVPIENPDYKPEYTEPRTLPGRPDIEAVICHECAHALCEQVPWLDKLIQPLKSHAHHTRDIPDLLAAGHKGWDLDSKENNA